MLRLCGRTGWLGRVLLVDQEDPIAQLDAVAAVDEPARPQVGQALERLPGVLFQGVDDAAVGHHQDLGAGVSEVDAVEGFEGASQQHVVGLEAGRALKGVEVAGPVPLDLRPGETGPLPGVTLTEAGFDDDGPDPECLTDDGGGVGGPLEVRRDHHIHRADSLGGLPGLLATQIRQGGIGLPLPPADGVPLRLAVAGKQHAGHPLHGSQAVKLVDSIAWSSLLIKARLGASELAGYPRTVPTLRLFAAARDAAGTGRDLVPGETVGDVLDVACERYGEGFAQVLTTAKVWCNGEPADREDRVVDTDEVAVLPPVSGGGA